MKIMLDQFAITPERAHNTDAGLDLCAPWEFEIAPHSKEFVDSGVHIEIPRGYVGLLTSKSGLMNKCGITTRGTIDCGYTGSIGIVLFNHSSLPIRIERGQKIAQIVIVPCITPILEIVNTLGETDRGDNGFGSTGKFTKENK